MFVGKNPNHCCCFTKANNTTDDSDSWTTYGMQGCPLHPRPVFLLWSKDVTKFGRIDEHTANFSACLSKFDPNVAFLLHAAPIRRGAPRCSWLHGGGGTGNLESRTWADIGTTWSNCCILTGICERGIYGEATMCSPIRKAYERSNPSPIWYVIFRSFCWLAD